jgi:hypothetical protein
VTQRERDLRRLVAIVGLFVAALVYEDDPWLIFRLDRQLAENRKWESRSR